MSKASIDKWEKFFQSVSEGTMSSFAQIDAVNWLQTPEHHSDKTWQAMIMVFGEKIKLIYKVRFNSKDVIPYIQSRSGITAEKAEEKASTFMKEFCNLLAGRVKRELENQGVVNEISLPLHISNNLEFTFFKETQNIVNSNLLFGNNQNSIYVTFAVDTSRLDDSFEVPDFDGTEKQETFEFL